MVPKIEGEKVTIKLTAFFSFWVDYKLRNSGKRKFSWGNELNVGRRITFFYIYVIYIRYEAFILKIMEQTSIIE